MVELLGHVGYGGVYCDTHLSHCASDFVGGEVYGGQELGAHGVEGLLWPLVIPVYGAAVD